VDTVWSTSRFTLADGATIVEGDPPMLRCEEGKATHIVKFRAQSTPPAAQDPRVIGWITRVEVAVDAGSSPIRFSSDHGRSPFGEKLIQPGLHTADLFHPVPVAGDRIVLGIGRGSGVTTIRVLSFSSHAIVEDGTDVANIAADSDALVPHWSRYFGEPHEGLIERFRYFRFNRLTEPKAIRWRTGLDVVLVPGEQISQALYVSGMYEPCTTAVLKHVLHEGDTFVDIGANIGLISMVASRFVGASGSVISFEPSSRELARLRQHVEHNGLSNVRPVQAALGRHEGSAVLRVAGVGHSGLNTIEKRFMYPGVEEAYTETVPVVRLDDALTQLGVGRVHVLKIDVEGGEHDVIEGARETITRDRPVLLLEVAGAASAPGHEGRLAVEALLASLGYEIVAIDGHSGSLRRMTDLSSKAENFLVAQPEALAALGRALPIAPVTTRRASYNRPAVAPGAPYISIILTGRNDDFGGNFNDRLFKALEFNHRHLNERGVPHEFIFCEWRPVPGKPWLAEVLADRYPELVPHTLTSYVADIAYHDAYSLNPKLQFQEFIAKNIGIRRCRGAYILTTNTDVYLSRGVLDVLERRDLEPRIVYRVPRIDLKDDIDCEQMDWSILEDHRNVDMINEIQAPLYTNASGDFLLLDRDSYADVRGFNEVYRVAKVHMDSNFCLKAYTAGLTLTPIDAPVYHVGRGTLNSQVRLYAERPQDAPWGDRRWKRGVLYDNSPEWGLARAPIREVKRGIHFLDFSWDAVPPTVELKRVVLPAERVDAPSALPQLLVETAERVPAYPPPYPVSVKHRELVVDPTQPQSDHHVFDDGLAVTINKARLDFLASLKIPYEGKRVLDAGCGVGHHTSFYISRGCKVVGIDGRPENIAMMKQLYPEVEGLSGDLQVMDLKALGSFDIVHCLGLLYHLDSPVTVLRKLAEICSGYLVLETMVCDSKEPVMVLADEQLSANQALAGLACRPSPSFVAMTLDRLGFSHVYGTTAPPDHPDFKFEWHDNRDISRDGYNLRCMFVASRRPIGGRLVELISPP
jgi:FkbM family methyltransferase